MTNTAKNPYVGPRTFLKEEGHLFFGREREASDLLSLVVSQQLVLFYAQSGAGKSSIINTRLAPSLEEKGFEVLPIGRVSGDLPPADTDSNVYTFNLMRKLIQQEVDSAVLAKTSLTEFLKNLNSDENGYYYDADLSQKKSGDTGYAPWRHALVIDQFEELFSTHPEAWEKREDFFLQLAQAMKDDPYLWVVLVMREDYIASLDPYAHLLPGGLRVRYYMQRLGRDAALKAVKNPVEGLRPFVENVAEKLVDDLCSIKVQRPDGSPDIQPGQYVEPVQLQVVCYSLWENLPEGGTQITEEDLREVGDVNQSLGRYYAGRVKAVAGNPKFHVKERTIREWFEKSLIAAGGIRNMVLQDHNGKSRGLLEDEVIQALQSDLVRAEKRSGATWYELTHDRLVEPVLQDNKIWFEKNLSPLQRQARLWSDQGRNVSWLLRDQALAEVLQWAKDHTDELSNTEKEFLEACQEQQDQIEKQQTIERMKLEQAEEQARSASQARRLTRLAFSLLGIALVGFVLAFWGMSSTTKLSQILLIQKANAEDLANTASARELATQAEKNFDKQLDLSILLSLEAYKTNTINPKMSIIPQVNQVLYQSVQRSLRMRGYLAYSSDPATQFRYSPDGETAAIRKEDGITLWNLSGNPSSELILGSDLADQYMFSPDGSQLIYLTYEGLTFWDVKNHKKLFNEALNGHTGEVGQLAFGADGNTFATVGENGEVDLWGMDGTRKFSVDHAPVTAFSPDGREFATLSSTGTITIGSMVDGKQQGEPISMEQDTVTSMAFNQGGDILAIGEKDGTIILRDLAANKEIANNSVKKDNTAVTIDSITFSADGKFLVLSDPVGNFLVWSLEGKTGTPITGTKLIVSPNGKSFAVADEKDVQIIPHDIPESATPKSGVNGTFFAFSEDGSTLAVFDENTKDNNLALINVSTGKPVGDPFPMQSSPPVSMAFSRDGNLLALGAADGSITIWDVPTRKMKFSNTKEKSPVISMAFSPNSDEPILVGGRKDGSLFIWNAAKDMVQKIKTGYQGKISSINLSPKGTYIYTVANDGIVLINAKDLVEGKNVIPGVDPVFSPDENTLALGEYYKGVGKYSIWDLSTGKKIKGDIPAAPMFSPKGNVVTITEYSPEVSTTMIWDLTTNRQIGSAINGGSVAFSPDGKKISVVDYVEGSGVTSLWNTSTGEQIGTPTPGINAFFSPDGSAAAVTDYNYNITILDLSTGEKIEEIKNKTFVVFSSDGGTLVSTDSSTGQVVFWDVKNKKQIGEPVPSNYTVVSPDGRRIAIAYNGYTLWDIAAGKPIKEIPPSSNLIFSPDGKSILTSDFSYRSFIWNLSTYEKIEMAGSNQSFQGFSPGGKYLIMMDNSYGGYAFWNTATGKQVGGSIQGHLGKVFGGASDHAGSVQARSNENNTVYLSASSYDAYPNVFVGSTSGVNEVFLLSPNEETFITFSADGSVILWNVESPASMPGIAVHNYLAPAWTTALSPDGGILAVSTKDNISLWKTGDDTKIGDFENLHVEQPTNVALAPNGSFAAVTNNDGSLSLWNVDQGKQVGDRIHESFVSFSPDGRVMVTSLTSSVFTLWNTSTAAQIGESLNGDSLQFTRGGRYLLLISYSGNGIRVFDTATGEQKGEPVYDTFLGFGPDDGSVITTTSSGNIVLWDVITGSRVTKSINLGFYYNLTVSPDGRYLEVTASDSTIAIWDLEQGTRIGGIKTFFGEFRGFSPDGQSIYMYSYEDGSLVLYATKGSNNRITKDPIYADSFSFSPDGKFFAAYYSYGPAGLNVYDASTGEKKNGIGIPGRFWGFGNNGKLLVTLTDENKVNLWSVDDLNKQPVSMGYSGVFGGLVLSGNGNALAIYGSNGTTLYDLSSLNESVTSITETTGAVNQMTFSPNRKMLATIGNDGLILWDVEKFAPLGWKLQSETGYISSAKFSRDGKTIAYLDSSGNTYQIDINKLTQQGDEKQPPIAFNNACAIEFDQNDDLVAVKQGRTLQIIKVDTNKVVAEPDIPDVTAYCNPSMAFSSDGTSFAYISGDRIFVFSSDKNDKPFAAKNELISDQPYYDLAFVDDNTLAMRGYNNGYISLWDIQTRSLLLSSGQANATYQPVSDGKLLLYLPSEEQSILMDFTSPNLENTFVEWKKQLCEKVGRTFSPEEWSLYFPGVDYPAPESLTCPQ